MLVVSNSNIHVNSNIGQLEHWSNTDMHALHFLLTERQKLKPIKKYSVFYLRRKSVKNNKFIIIFFNYGSISHLISFSVSSYVTSAH